GDHPRRELLGIFQQAQGSLVTRAGANRAIKPRHGLGVVIENVRACIQHNAQSLIKALKVGDEHLDATVGYEFANLANRLGKPLSPADVVVVPIYAGYYGMLEAKPGNGLCDAARLIPINRPGLAFGYGAKTAAPGADVAQQHECRGAVIPALANVRTLGGLAHRVQSQSTGKGF